MTDTATSNTARAIFVSVLGALALSAACVGAAIGPAYAAPAAANVAVVQPAGIR